MLTDAETRILNDAISDINDALSGVDNLKEGLGLRGKSTIEVNLEAAKDRLKRLILKDLGQM